MREIISEGLTKLGLPFAGETLDRFQSYYEYLTERNAVMNLTAINGAEDTARLHFLDCASLMSLLDISGKSLIDIGSGAGFPGIPLKLLDNSISLTLLDSHKKRTDFLASLCEILAIRNTVIINDRAEAAVLTRRERYDIAVSRAVAKLNVLCELCMPFVKVGGVFVAMKGPDCSEELREAKNAISLLGGGESKIIPYTIPGTDITHSAVVIKKTSRTYITYPRQFSIIKKSPL